MSIGEVVQQMLNHFCLIVKRFKKKNICSYIGSLQVEGPNRSGGAVAVKRSTLTDVELPYFSRLPVGVLVRDPRRGSTQGTHTEYAVDLQQKKKNQKNVNNTQIPCGSRCFPILLSVLVEGQAIMCVKSCLPAFLIGKH